ncbi:MAG: DUF1801 domain-containing protein [Gemmataceae bacterium]|nr:DUF1801 domain-containing protein [Gemmataceae bacterium]
MVSSKAKTVAAYLKELPAEKREVVAPIRKIIVKNLPKGYVETMNWGMICYEVPLKILPDTYNNQPLCYLSLAAQKNYFALHCMCVYMSPVKLAWLKEEFKKAGKKLDMGKACLRFKKLEDIPLMVVGELAAMVPMKDYVASYKEIMKGRMK